MSINIHCSDGTDVYMWSHKRITDYCQHKHSFCSVCNLIQTQAFYNVNKHVLPLPSNTLQTIADYGQI